MKEVRESAGLGGDPDRCGTRVLLPRDSLLIISLFRRKLSYRSESESTTGGGTTEES